MLASDARLVLKHGVQRGAAGVLRELLKQNHAEQLCVVLSAASLRRRNAALSRTLSWDQVLEDIEKEFQSGASSRDLAQVELVVVHFGLAGAAVLRKGRIDRLIFLPDELEGVWEDDRPGRSFGTTSVLTATLVRHLLHPQSYPIFFAITQALAAQRKAHDEGAGADAELNLDLAFGNREPDYWKNADGKIPPAAERIRPPQEQDKSAMPHLEGIADFRAHWNPVSIRVWPEPTAPCLAQSRLLCNVTGTTPESLLAKAGEVVIQGVQAAACVGSQGIVQQIHHRRSRRNRVYQRNSSPDSGIPKKPDGQAPAFLGRICAPPAPESRLPSKRLAK